MEASEYKTLIDDTIKTKVIEGTIPIIVRIAGTDGDKYTLFNASRNEYLPCLLKNSLDEFLADTGSNISSVTYTVNDIKVKWTLPIGVIFDLISNGALPMEVIIGVVCFSF